MLILGAGIFGLGLCSRHTLGFIFPGELLCPEFSSQAVILLCDLINVLRRLGVGGAVVVGAVPRAVLIGAHGRLVDG